MKNFRRILALGLAAGLGVAIGFGIRWRKPLEQSQPATSQTILPDGPKGRRTIGTIPVDDSPLARKLEQDLAISRGVQQWLLWLEAVEKAGPADFPRLAKLAQGKPGAMQFLAARWADVAPRHLFDTLVAALRNGGGFPVNELAAVLFDQWPKKDPEAAIAALNEPGDLGMRGAWQDRVADTIIRIDAERGLRLMAEWHIENYSPSMSAINKWAAADPQHAAEFTVANGLGTVAADTMEAIGKAWAKSDPAAALAFAESHPGHLGSSLASSALKQWASADRERAGEWLANIDTVTRNRLVPAFVETWAKRDASAALNWCQENLTGSSLAQGVSGVIGSVAAKDPLKAAALVSEMEASPARAEAAVTVARAWMPGLSSDKRVSPEMVAWLSGLDNESCLRAMTHVVVWDWATSDPKTMAEFILRSSREKVPDFADTVLARQLTRKSPTDALDWAGQLPGERGVKAGATAFAEWRNTQPESAMNWFNNLAPDDPRRDPFFKSAIETLAWHPQAVEQLAAMNERDRNAALSVIQSLTMPDDRRQRLLSALGH